MTPSPHRLALGLPALLLLLAQTGCLSFCHPIEPPSPEVFTACKELPQPCRNHVYVFFIHGMDPLDFCDLSGVRDYVQSLGFIKTYYGQLYHTWYFTDEIRKVHQRDPEARFALVGFSFGANMVRNVANAVRADGVNVDLIVYLGGNTLTNSEEDRPPNVADREHLGDGLDLERHDDGQCREHQLRQRMALRLADAPGDLGCVGSRTGGSSVACAIRGVHLSGIGDGADATSGDSVD